MPYFILNTTAVCSPVRTIEESLVERHLRYSVGEKNIMMIKYSISQLKRIFIFNSNMKVPDSIDYRLYLVHLINGCISFHS